MGSIFAVAFAHMGSRVIYGLGREIAKARAMGSYQLEDRLGAGGMGEVWRAKHRLLARTAAIKLIRPELIGNTSGRVSEQARQRFEREAQTIASLKHPNICVLHDIGRDQDRDFLVMEFLDGETLGERIKKGPIALDELNRLGAPHGIRFFEDWIAELKATYNVRLVGE